MADNVVDINVAKLRRVQVKKALNERGLCYVCKKPLRPHQRQVLEEDGGERHASCGSGDVA